MFLIQNKQVFLCVYKSLLICKGVKYTLSSFLLKRFGFFSVLSKRVVKSGSSRSELSREKGVLKNFVKFTGKHLYRSNKVAGLKLWPEILLKLYSNTGIFL